MTWYTQISLGGSLNQTRSLPSILGFFLFIAAIIGLVWGNYQFADRKISGEGFLIQWIGIRGLIDGGQDPYSDATTAQIQDTVKIESSFEPGNPPKYTSPLFSGIVIFPLTILENRSLAHAIWLSAQLIAIFLIQLLGLKLCGWRPTWYVFLIFSLLATFSYHVFIPWLDGGLSIWAALFLVVAFIAIQNNWNEIAGVFLALAIIQPQMTILVIIFSLIWAVSQRRRFLLIWFFITLIILSVVGVFLVPGWPLQYLGLIYNYTANFPPGNPGALFSDLWPNVGRQLGWTVTALCSLVLLLEWWQARQREFRWFLWTACLTLAVNQWIGIPSSPGNLTVLMLPLILVSAMLTDHWPRGGQWVVIAMSVVVFTWEWALYYRDITSAYVGTQLNLLFPLPIVLIIGLYWVRWWAIKPRRLLIEELKLGETY